MIWYLGLLMESCEANFRDAHVEQERMARAGRHSKSGQSDTEPAALSFATDLLLSPCARPRGVITAQNSTSELGLKDLNEGHRSEVCSTRSTHLSADITLIIDLLLVRDIFLRLIEEYERW